MTTIPPSKGGGNGGLGPGPAALLLTTAAPEQSRCFSFCFGSKILLGSFANTRQHILPEHGWKSQPLWATGLDLPSLPAGRTPSVTCIPLGRRKDLGTVVLSGLLPYPPMCWKRNHTVVVTGCFKRLSRWHCALPFRADRRERGHFLGLFFLGCLPAFHISSGLDVDLEISFELTSFGELSASLGPEGKWQRLRHCLWVGHFGVLWIRAIQRPAGCSAILILWVSCPCSWICEL